MARPAQFAAGLLLALTLLPLGSSANDLEKQRQRLARATDPGERAKITAKIGDELLELITRAYKKSETAEAERLLAEYRDAIRDAGRGLLQSGRDARRRPKGFKEMEIHLRKGARKLLDVSQGLPYDQRETLEATREEMEALRQELLAALMKVDNEPKTDPGAMD